ncbi:M48 family peptidase [Candidatus Saccharibacteria bacterium]|nr:M48 family peptidase [Candidatus Saccharibacteria bacterium]
MSIIDEEFGEIAVRRSKMARSIKISIAPNGKLRASMPLYAPELSLKRLVRLNRAELRQMFNEQNSDKIYRNNQQIGKSHTLIFKQTSNPDTKISTEQQYIVIELAEGEDSESFKTQTEIRMFVGKVLRKQAKAYLSRRLEYLAREHNFEYDRVRFSHASTRWGSCSSNGTISLNIGLMNLPHELIDYVIIHELCHTRQMNHSDKFWSEVEKYDSDYKKHVSQIKKYNPGI